MVPESTRRAGPPRRVLIAAAVTTLLALGALFLVSRDDSRATDDDRHRVGLSHYTVREGDTITSVAELHGVEVDALLAELDLSLSDSLEPGDTIDIPEQSSEGHEWPRRLVDDPLRAQQNQYFERYAREYDVPTSLLQSLAWVISSWDNNSVNEGEGDLGIGRIDTDMVGWINEELIPGDEMVDPRSPEGNVELTAAYLGHLLEVTGGDHANAVATYFLDETEPSDANWDLHLRNFITSVLVLVPDFEATPPPSATTTTTTTAPED